MRVIIVQEARGNFRMLASGGDGRLAAGARLKGVGSDARGLPFLRNGIGRADIAESGIQRLAILVDGGDAADIISGERARHAVEQVGGLRSAIVGSEVRIQQARIIPVLHLLEESAVFFLHGAVFHHALIQIVIRGGVERAGERQEVCANPVKGERGLRTLLLLKGGEHIRPVVDGLRHFQAQLFQPVRAESGRLHLSTYTVGNAGAVGNGMKA